MQVRVEKGTVFLAGELSEHSVEQELKSAFHQAKASSGGAGPITVNLGELKHGNSSGLAMWLRVIKALDIPLLLTHVPVWMIYQLNDVAEMLSTYTSVESFYAPYYSAELDESKNFFMRVGVDIVSQTVYDPKSLVRHEGAVVWEPDFECDYFLGFLQLLKNQGVEDSV